MSIQLDQEDGGRILVVHVSGKLEKENYDTSVNGKAPRQHLIIRPGSGQNRETELFVSCIKQSSATFPSPFASFATQAVLSQPGQFGTDWLNEV